MKTYRITLSGWTTLLTLLLMAVTSSWLGTFIPNLTLHFLVNVYSFATFIAALRLATVMLQEINRAD